MLAGSAASADFIWDEIKASSNLIEGRVKKININPNQVSFVLEGSDNSTQTLALCPPKARQPNNDGEENVMFRESVATLREARRSQETVQLHYKDTWDSCIQTVSISSD
jgi:hypothetical protein